ncbi:MAG TPA: aspartate kinase [Rhabdochlamydiaceae bacterium]|nr:aspartate kinase [Rhabdochlamydiaceae bacterium]
MESKNGIIVMKFGGAAVSTPEKFAYISEIILKKSCDYPRIVIVVSAMGKSTDELLTLAKKVHPSPPKREQDMLLTVGERISIALLAMALSLKNKEAISFTGSQSGIITCNHHCDAFIVEVRPYRILKALDAGKIVIVAGFQGMSMEGEITTLGRGGSDTSAVALAAALKAEKVEFYKDVLGIFCTDPKLNRQAEVYPTLTFDEALEIAQKGAKVLHPRAIELAKKNHLPLHVLPFEHPFSKGTLVGTRSHKQSEAQFELQRESVHEH